MSLRRGLRFSVLMLALVMALAACGGGGGTPAPAGGGKTINVSATEFAFTPNEFNGKVGEKITFRVANKGTVDHNFVILNADGSQELAKMEIKIGETGTLEFTPTAAGEYQIDCNLPGHKEAGMIGKLIVK